MSDKDTYLALKDVIKEIASLTDKYQMGDRGGRLRELYLCAHRAKRILDVYEKWGINCSSDGIDRYNMDPHAYISIIEPANKEYAGIPDGEELFRIAFLSGPHVFGPEYYTDLFDNFYQELHEIPPKYEDKINHELYYDESNAADAYEHYKIVFDKYLQLYRDRAKTEEIRRLEIELEQLRGDSTGDDL